MNRSAPPQVKLGGGGSRPRGRLPLAALAVAIASSVLFIRHARSAERPVLDLSLFKVTSFRASCTAGTLIRIGIGATPFLMPLLLQIAMGWTPLQAGSLTISMAIGALISRPLATRMMRRLGFRGVLVSTAVLVAIFTATPGLFRTSTPVWIMFGVLAVGGFVRATQFTASNAVAFVEVGQKEVTAASTLQAVILQLSISLGITVGSLALQLVRLNAGPVLTPSQFTLPFCIVGVMSLLAAPVYASLHKEIGSDMTGHRRR